MSTELQNQASRATGSKSRGPATSLSGTIVLECESTDRFDELVATLYEEFQPQTPFEESLIDNMAAARWRQMRIWGMEKAGMDHEFRRQAEMSNSISTDSTEDNATRASIAFRALGDDSRSLDLIKRYDSSFERQYYRAHRRFLEVRDRRTPPSAEPAQLKPVPAPAMPPLPAVAQDAARDVPHGVLQTEPRKVLQAVEPRLSIPGKVIMIERTRQVPANKGTAENARAYERIRTQRPPRFSWARTSRIRAAA